jgi:hypothetical protein
MPSSFRRPPDFVFATVNLYDACALCCEVERRCEAEAACRPSQDGDFSF